MLSGRKWRPGGPQAGAAAVGLRGEADLALLSQAHNEPTTCPRPRERAGSHTLVVS